MDENALIDALRAQGAAQFDPVGWRFIEALARRLAGYQGEARRVLDDRLAELLSRFSARLDEAGQKAADALACGTARFPQAAEALQRAFDSADYAGLKRMLVALETQDCSGPLAGLLAHIGQHAAPAADAPSAVAVGTEPRRELKSVSYFRSTWSKLSMDQELTHSLAQAPANAGPLNSHYLVLQSLSLMRDVAPEYLKQFMSYADALLWLDQADSVRNLPQKAAVRTEREKKSKAARGKAG